MLKYVPKSGGRDAPVFARPHSRHPFGDACVVQQMLLNRNSTLLVVELRACLARPELDVEISDSLVKDVTLQRLLYIVSPNLSRIQMQVLLEAPGDHYSACELGSKLGWYREPALVVKLAFEIVYCHLGCTLV